MTAPATVDVVVIGAGFSGIAMTIAAKADGRDVLVLEQADEIGGTWRDNRYPGVACDVESHLYSYSFELNPFWSRDYAPGDEIQDYLLYVVEKYDLRPHIQFGANVQQAWYDDASGTWEVAFVGDAGVLTTVTCQDLVLAVGSLRMPVVPQVPGVEEFRGTVVHTAQWDPSIDYAGKRVGVVGTGASAVQVIPEVAKTASQVTVFQRTPTWVLPKNDHEIPERTSERFEKHPVLMKAKRQKIRAANEARTVAFTRRPEVMGAVELTARRFLKQQVPDAALRERLTPDYTIGCKRIPLSDTYLAAMAARNVLLETQPIVALDTAGAAVADGTHHALDLLVFATGFDPAASWEAVNVFGSEHESLSAAFRRGVDSYFGVTAPKFPNMYMLLGPNSVLGHTSVILMLEAQVELACKLMAERDRRGARTVQVRPEIVPAHMAEIDRRSAASVWQKGGCNSWYLGEDGRNRTLWPGSVGEYERRVTNPQFVDYEFRS